MKTWWRGSGRGSGGFPVLSGGAALAALLSAGWFARHATAPAVQAWRPGRGEFLRAGDLAEKSCALMCRYRRASQLLAIILSPDLPVTISGQAVLHTWPAYRGAISIFSSDWETALRELHAGQVPVTLVAGAKDPSQAPDLAADLSDRFSNVRAVQIPKATHILPLTHGALCAEQLR